MTSKRAVKKQGNLERGAAPSHTPRSVAAARPVPMWAIVVIAILLAGATVLVYSRTFGAPFLIYDDETYVTKNPHVLGGLSGSNVMWALTSFEGANWHPLTWLSHMLDVSLFGLQPGGHHAMNVALHALNAVVLFFLLLRLTGSLWPAAWVAAAFAIHPLHVESVAWIAERKDLLSALFGLLTIAAYAHGGEAPSAGRSAAVVLLFALGLMAKPMLVTIPFVLLLLDLWPLGRLAPAAIAPARGLVFEKIPLFALAAASSIVTYAAQSRGDTISDFQSLPLGARLIQAILAYAAYLRDAIWPFQLIVIRPHIAGGGQAPWIVLAAAVLLAATAVAIAARRRAPALFVGWFWYAGMLVPVIGLVQVGSQARADRYMYLPLIGLLVAVAWGPAQLVASWRPIARPSDAASLGTPSPRDSNDRRANRGAAGDLHGLVPSQARVGSVLLGAGAALSLAAMAALSWRQTGYWRSSTALFEHAVEAGPGNYLAEYYLGLALAKQHDPRRAADHFREAVRLWPGYAKTHNNLGMALAELGKRDEAMAHFREALRLAPGYPLAHNNLGIALAGEGRMEEAIAHFREAVRLEPDAPSSRKNLGVALLQHREWDKAADELTLAVRASPDDPVALYSLGQALMGLGRTEEAIARYREALRIAPALTPAQRSLDEALHRAGRAGEGRGEEPR